MDSNLDLDSVHNFRLYPKTKGISAGMLGALLATVSSATTRQLAVFGPGVDAIQGLRIRGPKECRTQNRGGDIPCESPSK